MDLSQLSDSDLVALKSGDLSKVSDAGLMSLKGGTHQGFIENAIGSVYDPLAKMVTGAIASPIANVAGLAATAKEAISPSPAGSATPEEFQHSIQNALTYQPRTQAGASSSNPLNFIPQAIGRGINAITPNAPEDASSLGGMATNLVREAVPQGLALAGLKYAPEILSKGVDGAQAVASLPGKAIRGLVGIESGLPPSMSQQIFKSAMEGNKTAEANMRGTVPIEQMLTDAQQGLSNIQAANHADYRAAKTGWSADQTRIDFSPIDKAFSDLESSLTHNGKSKIGNAEQSKVNEVGNVLEEWRGDPSSHTALGLDALKQRIDAIYPDSPLQNQAQRVISGVRNAVKDTIIKQAPDYAAAMSDYESQLGLIKDIRNALSLGDKVSKDTAIRKLQSLARDNANTNYGYRQSLADQLKNEGGVDVMPAVAGQSASSWTPRGLAALNPSLLAGGAFINPATLLGLPLTSPRLMGEMFNAAGKLTGAAKRAIAKVHGFPEVSSSLPTAGEIADQGLSLVPFEPSGAGYQGPNQSLGLVPRGTPTPTITNDVMHAPSAPDLELGPGGSRRPELDIQGIKDSLGVQRAFDVAHAQADRKLGGAGLNLSDVRAGGTASQAGTQALSPQNFTFYNAKIENGSMTKGERVEVVNPEQTGMITDPFGNEVPSVMARFVDRKGSPQFVVPQNLLSTLSRPHSPRFAQDIAETAYGPPSGIGLSAAQPKPRVAGQRISPPGIGLSKP